MRISTGQLFRQSLSSMLEQQAELQRANLQLASGKRLLSPSDDPAAATRVLGYTESVNTTQQYKSNAEAAQTLISLQETAVTHTISVLQRVRELAIQGNNDTLSSQERAFIAKEVRLLLDETLGMANSKDPSGQFLFSGYQNNSQSFSGSESAGYQYNGDDGQQFMQVSPERQIATTDSGRSVFGSVLSFQVAKNPVNTGTGTIVAGNVTDPIAYQAHTFTINFTTATTFNVTDNTNGVAILTNQPYTSGEAIVFNGSEVTINSVPNANDTFTVAPAADDNIFNVLNNLIKTLESAPSGAAALAQFHADIADSMNNIDQGLNTLSEAQVSIGSRLRSIDNQIEVNGTFMYQTTKAISEIEDLDYAEAITRFTAQTNAFQAAQMAFSKLQNLSLFNYM